jgi:stage V sporulation protein AE
MEYLICFFVGGIICGVGQLLMDATKLTAPKILVIFVVAGAVLQSFNVYQLLVDIAGAGARVPLPGFGYNLAKGAMEGAKEGLIEALTGGVKASAGGISIAISWGYIVSFIFDPKSLR